VPPAGGSPAIVEPARPLEYPGILGREAGVPARDPTDANTLPPVEGCRMGNPLAPPGTGITRLSGTDDTKAVIMPRARAAIAFLRPA